jgi:CRISPR/Cas system-associated exonuclease Cas4 (RecB family)
MDQELVEYLDRRFDEANRLTEQRFAEADRRSQQCVDEANRLTEQKSEEATRHFGAVAEDMDRKLRLVAEGVSNLDEKLERFRDEVRGEFRETQAMIRFSHADLQTQIDNLNRRLTTVEERLGLGPA